MSGTTFAGTFRHLGTDYLLIGDRHPRAAEFSVKRGEWIVLEIATGKVWRYRTSQGAWLKRKAMMAGVSVKVARGLPS